ncbi:MAG TPA: M20 family metallo-hydrolase [Candidatus Paraprevotella stercorigallinarum]|nr:M20 family metallo-hydrolase [Candidatus Paraprevotella stercorigallinarum]
MNMDINHLTHEATDLLIKMVSIPSVSREEKEVADFLEKVLSDYGLNPHRNGHNIWSICPTYDPSKPTLLLNAHIDTVKPTSSWTISPFSPVIEDGKLYGLGTNDDGASVVSLLQVYRQIIQSPQQYNIVFLASCEEEVSGKNGIEQVLPLLPHIDVALVGEPTGMQPAIAEKGLMVIDVTAHGKSGHAARNEGENAIYKALDDIQWFRQFHFDKESPLLGPVKMSVTIIQAGTQHNVIPDQCKFTVDVRSNEFYSNEEIFKIICNHIQGEAQARSFRLNSSHITEDHPLVKRAIELGRIPFGSPTLSDQALMKFPSLKMGPGQSSRSHTANEYIELNEIKEAITLYYNILNGLVL